MIVGEQYINMVYVEPVSVSTGGNRAGPLPVVGRMDVKCVTIRSYTEAQQTNQIEEIDSEQISRKV